MSTQRRIPRRGIYFLPSLFTVANIFCGFYSIVSSMKSEFELAAMLIGWAILLDTLDGRVARLANATSEFGKEFDSLADVVSFGVAPGVLAYAWALHLWPRIGWLACFLFLICGTMRLARFNIQQRAVDKRYFVGMPIPAAAGLLAAIVFMFPLPLDSRNQAIPILLLVPGLALLMVSTLRYYSFKDIDLRGRHPYLVILLLALLFVTIGTHPQVMLLSMSVTYLVSGLALKVYGLLRRSHFAAASPPEKALSTGSKDLDA
ncbi:MAG TPA: CDP-diacylglycerol--serine O-phosphatidyltransferase [Vicinamibacteria bacterium]|nr:CDP-diacylglycerol--serine O-phosphatidyltransferase [Vicinamibacteria bacterium]